MAPSVLKWNLRVARRMIIAGAAIAIVAACGSCTPTGRSTADEFCAVMPDSVGLYANNPVTQMGYQIGKVKSISPSAQSVRVTFTVNADRPLPSDVKAVIRSTSILANRSLELVGNYESGNRLSPNRCIPLERSLTPKSLSEVVGASTKFIDAISPEGSDNLRGVANGVDQALHNQGPAANRLLTTTSSVLDSPDRAIGDMSSITNNLGQLTTTLAELEPTLKGVFADAAIVGPDLAKTIWGASKSFQGIAPIISLASDLEVEAGPQIQQLLDAVAAAARKASPRAPFYASLLNITPRLINGAANIVNNHEFSLRYRPPLYRLRTPDGVLQCNIMNASVPGSCANVNGTPYAVDVALLQYVLTQASR